MWGKIYLRANVIYAFNFSRFLRNACQYIFGQPIYKISSKLVEKYRKYWPNYTHAPYYDFHYTHIHGIHKLSTKLHVDIFTEFYLNRLGNTKSRSEINLRQRILDHFL